MLWFYVLIFIFSCLVLVRSGIWTVRALVQIASFLGWKEFVVSFVLMAFATSIPELFIGVSSAFAEIPQLSLGNIFGANIIVLTLAVGTAVLVLGSLEIERATVRRNAIRMAVIALLPLFLLLDGELSRIDGGILLLAFVFYMVWLFERKELFTKVYEDTPKEKDFKAIKNYFKNIGVFLGSVLLLLLSAQGIIQSAFFFAQAIDVHLGLVGIFLVGAGTALPEVYFSIRAGKAGQPSMILGNLMGSIIVNSTFILGVVALIHPIKVPDFSPYSIARIFLVISVIYFLFISRTRSKISKKEAIGLVLIYFIFFAFEILN